MTTVVTKDFSSMLDAAGTLIDDGWRVEPRLDVGSLVATKTHPQDGPMTINLSCEEKDMTPGHLSDPRFLKLKGQWA